MKLFLTFRNFLPKHPFTFPQKIFLFTPFHQQTPIFLFFLPLKKIFWFPFAQIPNSPQKLSIFTEFPFIFPKNPLPPLPPFPSLLPFLPFVPLLPISPIFTILIIPLVFVDNQCTLWTSCTSCFCLGCLVFVLELAFL